MVDVKAVWWWQLLLLLLLLDDVVVWRLSMRVHIMHIELLWRRWWQLLLLFADGVVW